MKRLLIFDASNYMFRAFFASPATMTNSAGFPTNALHLYTSMILSTIKRVAPDAVALAHEARGKKFRHEMYPDYKGQRPAPDEALVKQFPWFRKITDALGLCAYDAKGYEADDIIATLTRQARELDWNVIIASSDKDLMQLVARDGEREAVVLFDPMAKHHTAEGSTVTWDDVVRRFNVEPGRVADVLALAGDKCDNIPGCRGIGEKTAGQLIAQYGSLENLMAHCHEITKKAQKANLEAFSSFAPLSKKLVTLVSDAPVTLQLRAMAPDARAVVSVFSALDLNRLLTEVLGHDAHVNNDLPKVGADGNLIQGGRVHEECLPLEKYFQPHPEQSITHDDAVVSKGVKENTPGGEIPSAALMVPQRTPHCLYPWRVTRIIHSAGEWAGFIANAKKENLRIAVVPVFDNEAIEKKALVGMALSTSRDCVYRHFASHAQRALFDLHAEAQDAWQCVVEFLCDDCPKSVYGIKPLIQYCCFHGMENFPETSAYFDVEIAAYLVHPERRQSLAENACVYLGENLDITPENWLGTGKRRLVPSAMPEGQIASVVGLWAQAIDQLGTILPEELRYHGLDTVYETLDLPLSRILARMEFYGIGVDMPALHEMSRQFDALLAELDQKAHQFGSEAFNINSPKSLGHFLFETLKLKPETKKNRQHGLSTDQDTLASIDHPIADIILEYRAVSKLRSTYTETLAAQADSQNHRIHGRFNGCVTATTRLSSSDPNLQNIPSRSELGRQIKRAFVPQAGWVFVSADYSQIELRLMAAFSQEPLLCDAYRKGEDVHARTAATLCHVDISQVSKAQRQLAKTINFGLLYGMGVQKLARETGITNQEAKSFLSDFKSQFPKLLAFLDNQVAKARRDGEIRTVFGHRRAMPELFSKRPMERAMGERIATNAPIQGSASDIVKSAMLRLERALAESGARARLLVQIHDELLLECPQSEIAQTAELLQAAMEGACELAVPLKVEIKTGTNWADMAPWHPRE